MRDTDGRVQPEWKRRALLPPDFRQPADDPDSPRAHPENFPPHRMWAHYFEGWGDPARCERVDKAVADGKCVAFGAVSGVYTVESILRQSILRQTYRR